MARTFLWASKFTRANRSSIASETLSFKNETVGFFPADAYERFDLDLRATPSDFLDARTSGGKKGHPSDPAYWELGLDYLPDAKLRLLQNFLHSLDNIRWLGNRCVDLLLKLLATEIGRPVPVKQLLCLGGKFRIFQHSLKTLA
jgi:hypothetical protein